MIDQISFCRGCVSTELTDVLKLQSIPIGDGFSAKSNNAQTYPIGLAVCAHCGLVQLSYSVDRSIVFERYFSKSFPLIEDAELDRKWIPGFERFVQSSVIETIVGVGSGSGKSLQRHKRKGITVIGIEPSDKQAKVSRNLGIDTLTSYFTKTAVEEILSNYGQVDLILVDNFTKAPHPAHISNVEDLSEYVKNIAKLVKPTGCVYLRVPYIGSILTFGLVDYVYHEHQSYFSYRSINQLFASVGLHVQSARLCLHDSLHAEFMLSSSSRSIHGDEPQLNLASDEVGLTIEEEKSFSNLATSLEISKENFRKKLGANLRSCIAGYGASTATVAMMYQYEIASDLDFLVDDNKKNIGLYSPNVNLRVENVDRIYTKDVDVLVILASRFADRIKNKHSNFGGEVIVPSLDRD